MIKTDIPSTCLNSEPIIRNFKTLNQSSGIWYLSKIFAWEVSSTRNHHMQHLNSIGFDLQFYSVEILLYVKPSDKNILYV